MSAPTAEEELAQHDAKVREFESGEVLYVVDLWVQALAAMRAQTSIPTGLAEAAATLAIGVYRGRRP